MSALLFPIVPNPHKSVTHEIGKHLASVGLDNKHLQGNVCSPLQRYKPAAMLWGNLRLGPQPRSNILERLQDVKPRDKYYFLFVPSNIITRAVGGPCFMTVSSSLHYFSLPSRFRSAIWSGAIIVAKRWCAISSILRDSSLWAFTGALWVGGGAHSRLN